MRSSLCCLGEVCIRETSGQLAPNTGLARGRSGLPVNRHFMGLWFS